MECAYVQKRGGRVKVVTPYRPFAPESLPHQRLGAFDWVGAAAMLRESVRRNCACETYVLTDVDAVAGIQSKRALPVHAYQTTERRLMLWLLDVTLAYLRSPEFDDDTAFISPDALVFQDLKPFFVADLGVVVRLADKYVQKQRELLNSVQFWRPSARQYLIEFYEACLEMARGLSEEVKQWGADTEPLRRLLEPFHYGVIQRRGLSVRCWGMSQVMMCPSDVALELASAGKRPMPPQSAVADFKYRRKAGMRAYFDVMFGSDVSA